MKPNFALNLTHERIELLHRNGRRWIEVGVASLESPDLGEELAALRRTALGLSPSGFATKLILPESQILYDRIEAPGPDDDTRRAQIRAALEGRTPYDVDELVFDWSGQGPVVQVAVVARETLDEAEQFAAQYKFNPVSFEARPEASKFAGEPFFGAAAHAGKSLGQGETVEREDREAALDAGAVPAATEPASVDLPKAQLPETQPVAAPEATLAPQASEPELELLPMASGSAEDTEPKEIEALPDHDQQPMLPLEAEAAPDEAPQAAPPAEAPSASALAAKADAPEDRADSTDSPATEDEIPLQASPAEASPHEASPVDMATIDEAPSSEAPAPEAPIEEAPVEEAPVALDVVDEDEPTDQGTLTLTKPMAAEPMPTESARPEPAKPSSPAPDEPLVIPAFSSRRATAESGAAPPAVAKPVLPAGGRPPALGGQRNAALGTGAKVTAPSIPGLQAERRAKVSTTAPVPDPRATPKGAAAIKRTGGFEGGLAGRTAPQKGKPRYLGLILTACLLLLLAAVAALSSLYLASNTNETSDPVAVGALSPVTAPEPVEAIPEDTAALDQPETTPETLIEEEPAPPADDPAAQAQDPIPPAEAPIEAPAEAAATQIVPAETSPQSDEGGEVAALPNDQGVTASTADGVDPVAPDAEALADGQAEPEALADGQADAGGTTASAGAAPMETSAAEPAATEPAPTENAAAAPPPGETTASQAEPVEPDVTEAGTTETGATPTDTAAVQPTAAEAGNPAPDTASNSEAPTATTEETPPQRIADGQDEIFLATADAPPMQAQTVAPLPAVDTATDGLPASPMAPLPFGTVFELDANGRIKPTAEGIVTPEGVTLFAGKPVKVPPGRPAAIAGSPGAILPSQATAAQQTAAAGLVAGSTLPAEANPETAAEPTTEPTGETATETATETPAATPEAATEPAVFQADPALADVKPRNRPASISPAPASEPVPEGTETPVEEDDAALTGPTPDIRLAGSRPKARPPQAFEVAAAAQQASLAASLVQDGPVSPLAVSLSARPAPRPDNFSKAVEAAVAAAVQDQTIQVAAAEPIPEQQANASGLRVRKPTAEEGPEHVEPEAEEEPEIAPDRRTARLTGTVEKKATFANAYNLSKVGLIGVYGSASDRRALVRQSNGRFKTVYVGDRIEGGVVASITDDELRYQKSGRIYALKMPAG